MNLFTWKVCSRSEVKAQAATSIAEAYPFPALQEGIDLVRNGDEAIAVIGDYYIVASAALVAASIGAIVVFNKVTIRRAEVQVDHTKKIVYLTPEQAPSSKSLVLCDLRLYNSYVRFTRVGSGAEQIALGSAWMLGRSCKEEILLVSMDCNSKVTATRMRRGGSPNDSESFVHAVTLRQYGGCFMTLAGDGNMFD